MNIVVYFVGYLYMMELINAQNMEHIKTTIIIWYVPPEHNVFLTPLCLQHHKNNEIMFHLNTTLLYLDGT
jgi:hypothetical protein